MGGVGRNQENLRMSSGRGRGKYLKRNLTDGEGKATGRSGAQRQAGGSPTAERLLGVLLATLLMKLCSGDQSWTSPKGKSGLAKVTTHNRSSRCFISTASVVVITCH